MNMMKRTVGCLVATLLLTAFEPGQLAAELLPPEKLAECKMHVVGMYGPENQSQDDRVYVKVKKTDSPIVLVLSGYYGAQWNLDIESGADIRQIIVAGYYEHSVKDADESIPVQLFTHFGTDDPKDRDFFWAYSWHTKNGRELRKRLKEITGLEIETFQGVYHAKRFVVDGKIGLVSEIDEHSDAVDDALGFFETARNNYAKIRNQELLLAQTLQNSMNQVRAKRQHALTRLSKNHPTVQQIDSQLETLKAVYQELGPADEKPQSEYVMNANASKTEMEEVIKKLVTQTFELELQLQAARVAKAEADLNRVKKQIERRRANADVIISKRVKEFMDMKSAVNEDPIESKGTAGR